MSKEGGLAEAHATFHELLATNEGLVKGAEEWSHVQGCLDCILQVFSGHIFLSSQIFLA